MSKQDNGRSYDVGYGKPPEKHRFKKGQSGNPKGRPRKSPSKPETRKEIIDRIFSEVIVLPNGKTMTNLEVILRRTIKISSDKGNLKFIMELIDYLPEKEGNSVDYSSDVREKLHERMLCQKSRKLLLIYN